MKKSNASTLSTAIRTDGPRPQRVAATTTDQQIQHDQIGGIDDRANGLPNHGHQHNQTDRV